MPKRPQNDRAFKLGLTDKQVIAKARVAWGDSKRAAKNVKDVAAETLSLTGKEIASGAAGRRLIINPIRDTGKALGDIWKVARDQAVKYIKDANEALRKSPPKIKFDAIPKPKKEEIAKRFAEEAEMGITRGGRRKR
jgi:hypothetical protein